MPGPLPYGLPSREFIVREFTRVVITFEILTTEDLEQQAIIFNDIINVGSNDPVKILVMDIFLLSWPWTYFIIVCYFLN